MGFFSGNHLSSKEKFSLRLAVGLWCLTMIVLVNAYSGTLTSYLTVPKLEPIVNTLAELSLRTNTEITSDFEKESTQMFLVSYFKTTPIWIFDVFPLLYFERKIKKWKELFVEYEVILPILEGMLVTMGLYLHHWFHVYTGQRGLIVKILNTETFLNFNSNLSEIFYIILLYVFCKDNSIKLALNNRKLLIYSIIYSFFFHIIIFIIIFFIIIFFFGGTQHFLSRPRSLKRR